MQGQQTTTYDHHHDHCWGWNKGISWRAIFAGALVAIGLSFLLNLFSIAIGLSVYSTSSEGMTTLAIGGLIGLFIGIVVVMFVAGFTAGAAGSSCCSKHNNGVVYGFTTWTLALLLTALLTSHVGSYISSYSNFIQKPAIIVTTEKEVATASGKPAEVTVTTEEIAQKAATGAFILFSLFFVGALAACFGGYCGVSCCGHNKGGCCDHKDVRV